MTLFETAASNATEPSITAALAGIQERIGAAARQAGRDPTAVELVAVSKTHPAAAVEAALASGQVVFGENRVQEASAKFPTSVHAVPNYACT